MNIDDVVVEELQEFDEKQLLEFAFNNFGSRAAIGTSLQKTGVVSIDIAYQSGLEFNVFFIDTLKNHEETQELLREVEKRYDIKVKVYSPSHKDIKKLYSQFGKDPYYSDEGQKTCCNTRKVKPKDKALSKLDVWISGIRADQSEHRRQSGKKASIVEVNNRQVLKINPLFNWTQEQIDKYIQENNVPYNKLYDHVINGRRYKIIGCEPCHVPVREDAPPRAGKFPWKSCNTKGCGIHFEDGLGI